MTFTRAVDSMRRGKFCSRDSELRKAHPHWYRWIWDTNYDECAGPKEGFLISSCFPYSELEGVRTVAHHITYDEAMASDWFIIEEIDNFF